MSQTARIVRLDPPAGLPGSEVVVECEGLKLWPDTKFEVRFDDVPARLTGASARRALAVVPPETEGADAVVQLVCDGVASAPQTFIVADFIADGLHPVANPAIDPQSHALYVTRSGGRGEELPVTIYRFDADGDIEDFSGDVVNPTGIAFGPDGQMYVSSRYDGTVYRVNALSAVPFAEHLGVATGLAFNHDGDLFVGDRTGNIFRVNPDGDVRAWAEIEPSVAAFHLAFAPDGALYVAGPTVSSNDAVWRISPQGRAEKFFEGFVRPQGLAFDQAGNLYVCACYRGRRGVWRIPPGGHSIELAVAGNNLVGLCFSADGDLIAATTDAVYSLPLGLYGTLLD
jgi:streptogramin lyase